MQSWYEFLQRLGMSSLDSFWFPLAIWTMVALLTFLLLRSLKTLNPLYHYHLRAAIVFALPLGIVASIILQSIGVIGASTTALDPVFIVFENPILISADSETTTSSFAPNFWEPNFLIGLATALLLTICFVLLTRLLTSFLYLKKLYNQLKHQPLSVHKKLADKSLDHVMVAFHSHPLVPFTFGSLSPVIILPESIRHDQEKVRMAIEHELVHIKRGDYLIQLGISMIETALWFHPIVRLVKKDIEIWREISCDQEVLTTTSISAKNYANMLLELIPLNSGIGSISVSMAVQESTIKKRIENMNRHKLYQTSVKRSLTLLALMILAITLPIACTDLRGPEILDERELEALSFTVTNPSLVINGKEITKFVGKTQTANGLEGLLYTTKEHGAFLLSPTRFEDSHLAGNISGMDIEFEINQMDVSIRSQTPISDKEIPIFVTHVISEARTFFSIGTFPSSLIQKENYKSFMIPPPAPTNALKAPDADYFVVVEEMPKLIGGMASIQSKVVYPEMAKRAGIQGRVVVQFIVNENGDVENPSVVEGIGGGCDEAALEAIASAKFEPGVQRGRPVRTLLTMPIIFRLQSADI